MTSTRLDVISFSESERLKSLLKNPEKDLQEIISFLKKKVEKTTSHLKESEERYRSMIEQTTDAVFCYEYDPPIPINLPIKEQVKLLYSCVLVECNIVCARSYGYERVEDVIGRKLTELFGTTSDSLDNLFNNLIKSDYHIVDGIGIEKLPNGDERYFLNNGHGVIENGNLLRVWGTFRDITERRKAEQKLKESEEKFRTISEQSLMGICIAQDNKIKYINKAYSDIFGYTVEEMMNWEMRDGINAIHPDDRIFAIDQLAKKQRGEKDVVVNYQYCGIKKSGEIIWVDQFSNSITYEGKPANLVILVDITKQKEVEEAFLREKKFTDTALNAQRDTFFIFEPSTGKAVRWNNAFKEFSGYSDEEISKLKTPGSYYREEDLNQLVGATELIEQGGTAINELFLITKEKNLIPFEYAASGIFTDEGNLKYIVAIGRDITERTKVQDILKENERALKEAQSIAHLGHFKLDTTTLEVSGSDELFKIFELNQDEANLDAFANIVHPDDREYDFYHINRGMETGESWNIEHRLICKDGTEKWVHAMGEATRDETGKIVMLIGTVQDITDRKKVEEVLYHERDLIRTLLDNHPDFIYFKDSKARFQHISKRFYDFFGRSKEDIIGKTDLELFPEEIAKQTHSEDLNIIQTGMPLINKEESSGDTWVLTTKLPWFDKEGNIQGLFGISRDITALKKAEQKIKESEEKFRTIAEQSFMGIEIVQDGKIKYVNEAACKILEFSVQEMKAWEYEDLFKFVYPEDLPIIYELQKKRQEGKEPQIQYSVRAITKSGKIKWLEISSKMVLYQGKEAIFAIFYDITDKKKAEQKLKESEEKFRTITEQSLMGIAILQNDIFEYVNQQIADLFGYTIEEMMSWGRLGYAKLIHPDDKEMALEQARKKQLGEPGAVVHYQFRGITKQNQIIWVEIYSNGINYRGNFADLITMIDISNIKEAEEKLRESEEKFRTIAEQSLIGIGIVQDDIIKYCNKGLADMFGYSIEEMKNWPSLKFQITVHPDDRDFVLEQVRNKQLGLEDYMRQYQFRGVKKTGEIIWIDNFTQSIMYEGKPADLVTFVDITKTKKAEQELMKLDKMKADLLRRTSHELKTPLVSIKGFADLLLELHSDKLEDFVVDTITEIKQGCSRLETLIGDILKTSELEFGSVRLHKTEENLSFLIKLCISESRGFSELRKHLIMMKVDNNLVGYFEKEQIHQVISNILSNAIKYTPPYGRIEIESKLTGDYIIVSIKDNGIGLTQEEQSSIFTQFGKIERFGQGYDIISEGSGLGLYISKKIIELHGGKIWVESEGRNRGAKFFFSLPIIKS